MLSILHLPSEILLQIRDVFLRYGFPDADEFWFHYPEARSLAALARTNRIFHEIFNPALYRRSLKVDPPVDSCVQWAAENGRLETILRAVEYGADLNSNGASGPEDRDKRWCEIPGHRRELVTPLFLAIRGGHRNVFEYLLAQNVTIEVWCREMRDSSLEDAICYPLDAALYPTNPMPGVVEALVRRGSFKVSPGRRLHAKHLIRARCFELVREFMVKDSPISFRGSVYCAIHKLCYDLAKEILSKDLDGDWDRINEMFPGYGAYFIAAEDPRIDPDLMAMFVERLGARAKMTVAENNTSALHCAAKSGNLETAKLLLGRGGLNVNGDGRVWSPLHCAARRGYRDMVELLLAQPGVNAGAKDSCNCTALHLLAGRTNMSSMAKEKETQDAQEQEEIEAMKSLLRAPGIDLLAIDDSGWTPLHHAASANSVGKLKWLVQQCRLEIGELNKTTTSFLHVAVRDRAVGVVRYLLQQPDISVSDTIRGYTPLHKACTMRCENMDEEKTAVHFSMVQDLIDAGGLRHEVSDPTIHSPLYLALATGNFNLAKFLLERGARPRLPLESGFISPGILQVCLRKRYDQHKARDDILKELMKFDISLDTPLQRLEDKSIIETSRHFDRQ